MFTTEELNALGIMVANAPISGKDAKFVAGLLDKIQALLQAGQTAQAPARTVASSNG